MSKTKKIVETTQNAPNADSSLRRLERPLPIAVYASNAMLMATSSGPKRNRYRKSPVSAWQTAIEKVTTNASSAANDGSRQVKGFGLAVFSSILVVFCCTPGSSHFCVVAVAVNPHC
jgi:hypothetical protein